MIVKKDDIINEINELELVNKPVCIHSSLKSFGNLKGGPKSIVHAFMKIKCTIIVPTFSYDYEVPMPKNINAPLQNAYNRDEKDFLKESSNRIFNTKSNDIHYTMGALPKYVLSIRGRMRGNHPLNSFSAIGPNALDYIIEQNPQNVYAPFVKLYQNDGYLILMGVNLTTATIIHYAENLAGRNLFIRWANNSNGVPIGVNVGSCSDGFENLTPFLKSIEKRLVVGNSIWRVFQVKSFVQIVVDVIKSNPQITHCDNLNCPRCNDAIKGGPII